MQKRNLNLTLDIAIYGLLYACYVYTVIPLVAHILKTAGVALGTTSVLFWEICSYTKEYYCLPIAIVVVIIALLEVKTTLFDNRLVFWMVKLGSVIFLILNMVFLSLPIMGISSECG